MKSNIINKKRRKKKTKKFPSIIPISKQTENAMGKILTPKESHVKPYIFDQWETVLQLQCVNRQFHDDNIVNLSFTVLGEKS